MNDKAPPENTPGGPSRITATLATLATLATGDIVRQTASPNKTATMPPQLRKKLLAKVHCQKRDLGLDDDAWRAILGERHGVASAALLTVEQLMILASTLGPSQAPDQGAPRQAYTAPRTATGKPSKATQAQINQICALWSRYARHTDVRTLETWLERHFKCSRLEWLPRGVASKAIAALERAIAERAHA